MAAWGGPGGRGTGPEGAEAAGASVALHIISFCFASLSACAEAKQLHFSSDCAEAELPRVKEQLQKAVGGRVRVRAVRVHADAACRRLNASQAFLGQLQACRAKQAKEVEEKAKEKAKEEAAAAAAAAAATKKEAEKAKPGGLS